MVNSSLIPSNLKAAQSLIKSISKEDFREKILPVVRTEEFESLACGNHSKKDRQAVCDLINQAGIDGIQCNTAAVHWFLRAITSRIVVEHWHV